jgi:hypothetical protein
MARTRTSFKKGEGGKPKGALNRTTKEAQKIFIEIMDGQMDRVKEALAGIEDDEKYINSLSKLLQYYLPRKTDVTSDGQRIIPQMPTVIIKTKKNGSH